MQLRGGARGATGIAIATLSRQYLAFLPAGLILTAAFGQQISAERRRHWVITAVAGMLPLGALAILWGGLSPINELRAVYLSNGLGFDPHALSLYLALPGLYLAPLVAVVCTTVPFRARYLAAAGLPLLMAVVPLLGARLVRPPSPPDHDARTSDASHIVGSVLG